MKVRLGRCEDAPPPSARRLHSLTPAVQFLVGLSLGVAAIVLCVRAWAPLISWGSYSPDSGISIAALIVAASVAHGAIHVVTLPSGWSRATVGLSWSRSPLQVGYSGEFTRGQYIRSTMAPALFLSLAPFAVFWLTSQTPLWVVWVSMVNLAWSLADALEILLVLVRVPRGASMHLLGQGIYWRPLIVYPDDE